MPNLLSYIQSHLPTKKQEVERIELSSVDVWYQLRKEGLVEFSRRECKASRTQLQSFKSQGPFRRVIRRTQNWNPSVPWKIATEKQWTSAHTAWWIPWAHNTTKEPGMSQNGQSASNFSWRPASSTPSTRCQSLIYIMVPVGVWHKLYPLTYRSVRASFIHGKATCYRIEPKDRTKRKMLVWVQEGRNTHIVL